MSAGFWWRDDDAGRDHPRLHRLLALAERHRAPITLAVVPDWLEPAAAAAIRDCRFATVVQHGIAHRNHATTGKKMELGGSLGFEHGRTQLVAGRQHLQACFGRQFVPMLVPPWNRIGADWLAGLDAAGFIAVSTFGQDAAPAPVLRLNTHIDLIAWREGRRELALHEIRPMIEWGLAAEAKGVVGVLSHHLDMADAGFETLDQLIELVPYRTGRGWLSVTELVGRD